MSDDLQISAETLAAARTQPKKNNKKTVKWVVTGVLLTLVLGLFGYGMFTIFRPPSSVIGTYPLTQNLPPKSILYWGATGEFEKDNVDTPTGTWELNTETGNFTNTDKWETCNMYWNRLGGDSGNSDNDNQGTDSYTDTLFEGGQEDQGTVFFPVKKGTENVGSVEMKRSSYVDNGGQFSVAFYRHIPGSGLLMFGTVRCAEEQDIKELVPADATGDEISKLFDVWLATE